MECNTGYDSPLRVILATTGFSSIVDFLFRHQRIDLIGVLECRNSENNCYEYACQNLINHSFYKDLPHMESWMETMQADLMITYKVPFLLPRNIFDKPRYGTINIHPSLLPQYRGANPWFGIYYNKETESGVTIHKIDECIDHGDIMVQDSFPITLGSPLSLLQQEAERVTIYLLDRVFADWENIKPVTQDDNPILIQTTKSFDLKKLSDLAAIDGMRLWHILRGFPFLLKKMYPEFDEQYVIGDFLKICYPVDIGSILHTAGEINLICCDGSIQILKCK